MSQNFRAPSGEQVRALSEIDLDIAAGEFVCVVGPSGCGKTTIMNMVAGLLRPTTGRVTLGGEEPVSGHKEVGYLLAKDSLQPWRTALGNVSLPLEIHGFHRAEARERAMAALADVGLGAFGNSYPSQLSHGMRQRVAVARTLVTRPTTILFDEPFSALDAQTRLNLQELFVRLWEERRSTVIFITHDLAEAVALADRVVVISARPGRIKAQFEIDIPRPRSVIELQGSDQFHHYYQKIWNIIRQEMSQA